MYLLVFVPKVNEIDTSQQRYLKSLFPTLYTVSTFFLSHG